MMTTVAIRKTLEDTVNAQYEILDQYQIAFEYYEKYKEAMNLAGQMRRGAFSRADTNVIPHERYAFMDSLFKTVDMQEAAKTLQEMVSAEVWTHAYNSSNLSMLMDKEEKDKFRDAIRTGTMPECTVQNVYDKVEELLLTANEIFARGVANVFSKLDRKFRSHSGWKFGTRIILNNMFGSYGFSTGYKQDYLYDIYRVFCALKNIKLPDQYSCGILAGLRRHGWHDKSFSKDELEIPFTCDQDVYEDQFFKCRVFMNGNAHLYFKDKDLMRQINKILAEHYGEVIPEERKYDNDEPQESGIKYEVAKNYAFFPTPKSLVEDIIEHHCKINWRDRDANNKKTAFEPSAGTGRISEELVKAGYVTTVNDLQADFAYTLEWSGLYEKSYNQDFLHLTPEAIGTFDIVVMNPPFDRERDIDHVNHAWQFVKEGGKLVAIMSAHTEYSETTKAKNFRKLVDKFGKIKDLPAGSFKESGTNVNTIVVTMTKK